MIYFYLFDPRVDLGYLPGFLDPHDPRPAREQIDAAYQHGGGWRPQQGWEFRSLDSSMQYPGDPRLLPLAEAQLRRERLLFYDHEYLAIVQPDGSFEMARVN